MNKTRPYFDILMQFIDRIEILVLVFAKNLITNYRGGREISYMAASSLFALIDDIASILDDVSTMTKVAAKKTAGVLGDDLALNAQQVTGVSADRELPVVLRVAKGSLANKAILIPAALLISAVAEWAIIYLLMLGGLYLCYEGFEKLAHRYISAHDSGSNHDAAFDHSAGASQSSESRQGTSDEPTNTRAVSEKEKIRGAVRTDFILSAEIIVITLGTVAQESFWMRTSVLVVIGIIMTVGVYGLVAGIVKLDDFGLYLLRRPGEKRTAGLQRRIGRLLLKIAPLLMKTLSVVGTIAMFMVGGSILMHGVAPVGHLVESVQVMVTPIPVIGGLLDISLSFLAEILLGIVSGALVFICIISCKNLAGRINQKKSKKL